VQVPVGDGPDRQDAYAKLLTPRSYVADAQSSIGFQPVLCGINQMCMGRGSYWR
jgi:hypothetical protein